MTPSKQISRRNVRWSALLAAVAFALIALAACGGSSKSSTSSKHSGNPAAKTDATKTVHVSRPSPPAHPRVVPGAISSSSAAFVPAVKWRGQTAVSIAHLPSGIQMLSFDQRLVSLRLHSGTIDAGASGFRYGPAITGRERFRVVAAFNGGFRLSVGAGGFVSYGHVAVPLRSGLGSIVTYTDGTTDVGSWHHEVPAAGKQIASVRQNLALLIDHGHAATSVGCDSCWGATLGGVGDPARAALGVDSTGKLIWAAGEHATVATLTNALLHAHVVRAVELDINPEWVAGYLYAHHSLHAKPVPLPVVTGSMGIPGEFLVPWSRDFFTVVAR
jgi:hypothetical protein